ncbi:MAG: hypothetical protein B6244_04200 [Candidatus Cloacimonetes bacterium 4572_55]|nr:MAG: hypothetical protein B6244_04200 [Candidatus Cloacimonetes bacterium 4572_55]
MARKKKKFKKSFGVEAAVPTGSMSDIVFLMLLFFMITTVFKTEKGLRITLPVAEMAERVPKQKRVAHVWIGKAGNVSIDDYTLSIDQVSAMVGKKMEKEPTLLIAVRCDEGAPYGTVEDVLEEFKEINALNVQFTTKKVQG